MTTRIEEVVHEDHSDPAPSRLLGIHLGDHRAAIEGEIALARRARSARLGTTLANDLTVYLGEVDLDLDLVDDALAAVGEEIDRGKAAAARIGEKLGRLKPNGQLTGTSPLSPVVELEGLVLACQARIGFWENLVDVGALGGRLADRAVARRDAAERQLDVVGGHLRTALCDAVVPAGSAARGRAASQDDLADEAGADADRGADDDASSGSGHDDDGPLSVVRNGVRSVATLPPFMARHAWRSRIVERTHVMADVFSVAPPDERPHPRLQPRGSGVGPVVMRTYAVEITDAVHGADTLMEQFRIDPNHFASNLVAGFVQRDRAARNLAVGDELVVEIPGPWNGPCTIDAVDERRVLMATLSGHMEAGHIVFETVPSDTGTSPHYTFRVRSWARAGDAGFAALQLVAPIGKELQTAMWCAMCERAVAVSGGRRRGPITVHTEQLRGSDRQVR